MRQIRDFRCHECGTAVEQYVDKDTRSTECQKCHGVATSIISPVQFTLEGVSGSWPSASFKWDKRRQEKMKLEQAQGITAMGQPNQ